MGRGDVTCNRSPPTQPFDRTRPQYARMRVQTITPSSRIAPGGVAARRVVQTRALNFGKKKAAPPAKKSGTKFAFPGTQKKSAPAKKRAPPPKKQKQAASSGGGSILDQFTGGISEQFSAGDQRYYGKAQSGTKAKGAQKAVGYKGSGEAGSVPMVDAQGNKSKFGGKVFRYADKYGGNIDEYAPIFTPETRSSTGDTYAAGPLGLAVWAAGLLSLLAVGGFAIYSTSALAG